MHSDLSGTYSDARFPGQKAFHLDRANVALWLIADVHRLKPEGPLYPPKQAFGGGVSAFEQIVSA